MQDRLMFMSVPGMVIFPSTSETDGLKLTVRPFQNGSHTSHHLLFGPGSASLC